MKIMAIDYGDAHNILLNNGKRAKERKKTVDAVAASLMLEG